MQNLNEILGDLMKVVYYGPSHLPGYALELLLGSQQPGEGLSIPDSYAGLLEVQACLMVANPEDVKPRGLLPGIDVRAQEFMAAAQLLPADSFETVNGGDA